MKKLFPFSKVRLWRRRAYEEKTPAAKPPEELYGSTETRAMQRTGIRLLSRRGIILSAMVIGLGIVGCTTDNGNDPTKLQIESMGLSTVAVGDTSELWVVSKTFLDANGRTITTNPYTSFTLISSDTTVASVVNHQQLAGLKPGTVKVTAKDDKTSLVSENSVSLTVITP